LYRLDVSHEELHYFGNALIREFQAGNFDKARVGIEDLRAVYRKVCQILEQCGATELLKP
ncbi:MAG TPA: hypothetical protein PLH03_07390, partial [Methylophilaceae bacterium]|nr:hypothetical protein [Methylophilaceae bacterium]